MLCAQRVDDHAPCLAQIEALYRRAFPANERRPLGPLLHDPTGRGELLAFYDDIQFCGFAGLLTDRDITHIIYFAIDDQLRGRGYGTAALAEMRQLYPGQRLIVDIEAPAATAPAQDIRCRRQRFYQRSGYAPTAVAYRWRGEDYRILSLGGDVTPEEFGAFWRHLEAQNQLLAQY